MRKISEILADALESFGPNGEHWGKGAYYPKTTEPFTTVAEIKERDTYCALGAIHRSMVCAGDMTLESFAANVTYTGVTPADERRIKFPFCQVAAHLAGAPGELGHVASFNDLPTTTFGDIKAMFCTGIKKALEQEEREELHLTASTTSTNSGNSAASEKGTPE